MKCIFGLRKSCIVIQRCLELKEIEKDVDCSSLIKSMYTKEFTKSYCSYCIKSIYAKAKLNMAKKEVFLSL